MTPKEKAKKLINRFLDSDNIIFNIEGAKECALITVDEIVKQLEQYGYYKSLMTYWESVKQEIEKL